jgi:predicted lipoprotein
VPFTKLGLLQAVADCTLARYADFEAAAQRLNVASDAWAKELNDANALAARLAFRDAMAAWQRAESMIYGPAALMMEPGGKDIRDDIYAYPAIDRCRIDQQLVQKRYAQSNFAGSVIRAKGLGAYEYLAFYAGTANSCAPELDINITGSWAALGAELPQRRADYANAISLDVLTKARELLAAWQPSAGNFYAQVTKPAAGGVYPSEQDALNAISNAMYYVEVEVKDLKIGLPSGRSNKCLAETCPESLESPFARSSTANIKDNLLGFRQGFEGCGARNSGLGFDDWLRAVDAPDDLAGRMLAALTDVQKALDELNPPIEEAITTDVEKVRSIYDLLKKMTDLFKTEFLSTLDLEPPASAATDND